MKKLVSIILVVVLAISAFIGCSSKEKTGAAGSDGEEISGILMALNSDYWHMIESGILNGGSDLGVNVSVTGPTSESDVTGQVAMIEDAITSGASGIILAPTDTKAILPALKKAKEKNVPVVLIDMDIDEENHDLRLSFIGTSEYEAGKIVGQYIVDNFEACEIAVIRGLAGLPSHDARAQGMRDIVTEKGFTVVTEQPADSERGKAVNVAENIMESSPDVKIIYCTNDEMALGAYQAVESKGKQEDIFVIGFDGSKDALKSIKDGKLGASLAQEPITMGYAGVESIVKFKAGEKIESNVYTPVSMVDSKNVEEFEKNLLEQIERAEKSLK